MYILTKDLEIVPSSIYNEELHGKYLNTFNNYDVAVKAREEEIEKNRKNFLNI